MSYRYMRIIVFFDLPVTTAKSRRDYYIFRKYLIKSGFVMMQESVYCKLVQNSTMADAYINNIKQNATVRISTVTQGYRKTICKNGIYSRT